MTFSNEQISVESLPHASELDYVKLPPAYHEVSQASNLFSMILLLGAGVVAITVFGGWSEPWAWGGLLVGWPVLMTLSVLLTRQQYRHKGYALRTHDLSYRRGWLSRRVTTVPFNRIQHAEVSQGIIEKAFQLSSLKIYTAGGRSSDLSVPGLEPDRAHRLKALILKKANAHGAEASA
jgi:membrane protein YdbS with pleckstrin-like domain